MELYDQPQTARVGAVDSGRVLRLRLGTTVRAPHGCVRPANFFGRGCLPREPAIRTGPARRTGTLQIRSCQCTHGRHGRRTGPHRLIVAGRTERVHNVDAMPPRLTFRLHVTRTIEAGCFHRNTTETQPKHNRKPDVLNGLNGSLFGRPVDEKNRIAATPFSCIGLTTAALRAVSLSGRSECDLLVLPVARYAEEMGVYFSKFASCAPAIPAPSRAAY
jgi:hypothetical protein